ncbi:DUF975 family protein [Paenibacillus sp. PAMC21692]|uniref:DUF975 family protein n=1 Tax=Paenibacillus sp. PAMC21692 TaxID=2762320 RepID=UPI00164D87D6|nr:DUF975 family protein [Paenibacillus sp. PAMC21692]QNK56851.1 DUF975 family protein [Paenibacillus sp. PAMC21692]
MWTRAELKQRAKNVLRTTYWKAFLVSIILLFVGGGGGGFGGNFSLNLGSNDWGDLRESFSTVDSGYSEDDLFDEEDIIDSFVYNDDYGTSSSIEWSFWGPFIIIMVIVFIIVLLFALAFRIFLLSPLEVGSRRYFKQAAEQDANLNNLGYAFGKGRYVDIIKSMFWRGLLNFLWYLLLIIPGIIKSYAYSLVPYILADNPNIGYRRAVQLSNQMTRGHKFRIFVLDLSFIGWFLLGLLALFVGYLFVLPYYNATKAELYLTLRKEALERGMTAPQELRLTDDLPPIYV